MKEEAAKKFKDPHMHQSFTRGDLINGLLTGESDISSKIKDTILRNHKGRTIKLKEGVQFNTKSLLEKPRRLQSDPDIDMYKEEMNNQVQNAEKDKERMQGLESSLQDSLRLKRQEFEELKVKYDDAAAKVTDLERRLNNQTEEVLRLTAELESYEYE